MPILVLSHKKKESLSTQLIHRKLTLYLIAEAKIRSDGAVIVNFKLGEGLFPALHATATQQRVKFPLVLCWSWCWCWDREWSSLISGQWAEWDRHQLQNMVLCIWLVQHSTHITSNSGYFLLWASLAAWRAWHGSNGSSALNSVASNLLSQC